MKKNIKISILFLLIVLLKTTAQTNTGNSCDNAGIINLTENTINQTNEYGWLKFIATNTNVQLIITNSNNENTFGKITKATILSGGGV